MEVLYIMIPAALYLGVVGVVFLVWSIRTGQFDDMEGPKYRILFDDDEPGGGGRRGGGEGPGAGR
ncbi:MAG TPA: cbb3-type cytochrome oxidase assembly protein CcoS [Deltaproteobacteria bacterium]|nr:cbb3-type cytochrome oxidase assembly protein CcoS [Deltaproteobacteria bacterium]